MRPTLHLLLVSAALLFAGCARIIESSMPEDILRPLQNAPERFLRVDAGGTPLPNAFGGDTCHNPLVDLRDGTRLTLTRSANGWGDYQADGGQYGVDEDERLRIRCSSGIPAGVVRR
ncbi:MAG: hypothetical protein SH809_04180 [Rhodothermales bacterium]|nr:hypothetical protein [Rhodothermales bacterium]